MSSVTLVHPAKAVGRNEMPLGRDIRVVLSNTIRQSPLSLTDLGSELPVRSDADYRHITSALLLLLLIII